MTGRKERQNKCPLIKALAGALPVYKIQTANTVVHKIQAARTLCIRFRPTPHLEKQLPAMLPKHKRQPLVDYQNMNE